MKKTKKYYCPDCGGVSVETSDPMDHEAFDGFDVVCESCAEKQQEEVTRFWEENNEE